MLNRTRRLALGMACLVLLAAAAPPAARAGSAAALVREQPALAACVPIPDARLNHIRGRYDTYYFGLDVIVNTTGSGPPVTVTPHPNLPPGTTATATGISYADANVTYQAGIGSRSVYQQVQVRGDQRIVTSVVNLDIIVPRALIQGALPGVSLSRPLLGHSF